nr:alpha-(1,3)-fucosyltransferase C-like isoform X2 [Procambarus clarkii]
MGLRQKMVATAALCAVSIVIFIIYSDMAPSQAFSKRLFYGLETFSTRSAKLTENRTEMQSKEENNALETSSVRRDPSHKDLDNASKVNVKIDLPQTDVDNIKADPLPIALPSRSTTLVNNITSQFLLPGDSNLPYIEPNYEEIKQLPEDLFNEDPQKMAKIDPFNPPLKKILFWNEAYSNKHFGFGFGREPFLRAGCRVNTCMTTGDRSRFPLNEIDALLWHFRSNDRSLPRVRSPHTRYVFWMMESASHLYGRIDTYNNLFNWTMTYRLDSDFPNPYGKVYRRRKPLEPIDKNYAAGKTKMAAWFVSNCNTIGGREKLVKNLRKWIQIDQYGHCSHLTCERKDLSKCHAMLSADYKFYFSFENSLCRDYATEKFFNMLGLDVVPVVYGFGNYSVQAPPHSYIDALSFPTAKALADYLIYLHKNDTAYNEYFRWKRFHWLVDHWAKVAKPYCDLCERLHNDNTTKVYNLKKWFVDDSHCKSSQNKKINAFIHGA